MDSRNSHRYDDIIGLPRPVSEKHPPMNREKRAAQFSPFAALTGFDAAIDETARLTESHAELDDQEKSLLDTRLRLLRQRITEAPQVDIIYFVPDQSKYGGSYTRRSGRLRRIDSFEGSLTFSDGFKVAIDDIIYVDSPIFDTL